MRDMKLILGSVLVALIVGAIGGWTVQGWRMAKQIAQLTGTMDRMILEHTEDLAKANTEALTRYAELERKKQEAVDEANRIAQRNARAAANARAESERLRNQVAAADRVSTATVASLREYTTTLGAVFGECVAEVERLAATADGHALDSRTLNGAWPR